MVTEAVLVEQRSSSSVNTKTSPITSSPGAICYYRIERDVSNQKPDYAIAQPDVSLEWVGVFKIPLHKLQSRIYELVKPIWIQIERYGDGYLVTDEDVNRHGVGSTNEDALQNYEEILLGYFESLSRRQERLSPRLRQDFEFLRRTISHM
jgi:predicted RNase H-like HicB family nuclease